VVAIKYLCSSRLGQFLALNGIYGPAIGRCAELIDPTLIWRQGEIRNGRNRYAGCGFLRFGDPNVTMGAYDFLWDSNQDCVRFTLTDSKRSLASNAPSGRR